MSVNTLTRAFVAGAPVAQYRIVKPGAADGRVVQASATTDALIGVAIQPGGAASGAVCEVQMAGIADVVAGGAVAYGALVSTDADGKAVEASATAGSNIRVLGIALKSAAANDIFPILIAPGSYQG